MIDQLSTGLLKPCNQAKQGKSGKPVSKEKAIRPTWNLHSKYLASDIHSLQLHNFTETERVKELNLMKGQIEMWPSIIMDHASLYRDTKYACIYNEVLILLAGFTSSELE